jgi:hypothetical protein
MANARWSVDFVHDQFAGGSRFRILNVIDDVTKESLAAMVDTSISGRRVARKLKALIGQARKAGGDRLGQRHRVHLERDPGMGCVFRSIRPAIPTTCAHLFRGYSPTCDALP